MAFWSKPEKKPHCLITITTSDFIPGTLVMLYTFFKYNKWFDGDIIIYGYGLSDSEKSLLERFPNVQFAEPREDLLQAIDKVVAVRGDLARKKMVFYSLNLFMLEGYKRYMYIDSDVLIQGDFGELMDLEYPMMCVPDRATYLGKAKDGTTFQVAQAPTEEDHFWYRTFNAGIMFFTDEWVNKKTYKRLLKLVDPDLYKSLKRPSTDQYLLNMYFRKDYHALPGTYNFRLGLAEIIKEREGDTLNTAKLVHFSGKKNPWKHMQIENNLTKHPLFYKAMLKWMDAYQDYFTFVKQMEEGLIDVSFFGKVTQR